ncbi:hypothetical protein UFOVP1040_77 [uncultured Caudovirales phage]|uniref:Uncharacterized protein n=1 Tax=uncultured Caudovirales phage TaxID=2100421 RepID=A0A6J5QGD4_9CAUD|nr:hypothetical protein UFOVP1040_77 [uncultured Caudovirales phage]
MKFQLDTLDTRTLSELGVEMVVRKIGSMEAVWTTPKGATEPVQMKIRLLGPDSDKYASLQRTISAQRIARAGDASRSSGALDPTQEYKLLDEEELESLAALTLSWQGMFNAETGEAIPCNQQTAAELYRQCPAIRDQASRFSGSRVNFSQRPAGG